MVPCQWPQPVAQQVGAAVAYPGKFEGAALDLQNHHRGTHAVFAFAIAHGFEQSCLCPGDGVWQALAGADSLYDGFRCQTAGDMAVRMAAHAVGYHPESGFGYTGAGVLVAGANMPLVAE